jgi:hypothetical protein
MGEYLFVVSQSVLEMGVQSNLCTNKNTESNPRDSCFCVMNASQNLEFF